MRTTCLGLIFGLLLGACAETYDHKGRTPLVELNGHFLYREDLQAVLPVSLSQEDSLQFSEHYIHNWVENTLLYEKAEHNIPDGAEIDQRVENYRRALIMHTYQQALISQKLGDEISEEDLKVYYERNQAAFKLERPLVKGLFIKVPLKSADINKVRRWYRADSQEAVEELEKYQMQHAVKYEYFYDKWLSAADVLGWIPLQDDNAEEYLNTHRQVELKDTAFYYFLNIRDYRPAGEQEPFELARAQVKDMLLNMKQVQFMEQVKDDLYKQAEEKNEIKYYK